MSEWLLDDDPPPAVRGLLSKPGLPKLIDDWTKETIGDRKIEKYVSLVAPAWISVPRATWRCA